MVRICFQCDLRIGVKEPIEDESETHGICGCCLLQRKMEMGRELKFPSLTEV